MKRKTVLLVCMVDSIHVARWISQFDPEEVKFILFPSGPNRRVHAKILDSITEGKQFDNQITLVPFGGRLSLVLWALDRIFRDQIRGLLLRSVIKKVNPDFVHALELQHAGYISIRALKDQSIKTPFIATNYGSDIYWFQAFPAHLVRIRKVLARADLYSSECERDVLLARKYGFRGDVLPVIPNAGGFESRASNSDWRPTSSRRTIAIKGYEGWAGKASLAIHALENVVDLLGEYNVVVYSADREVKRQAKKLSKVLDIRLTIFKKNQLSHEQVLNLFMNSRVYIGISRTDGISTSLLEAMAMGAYPIQTTTSCVAEWVSHEDGGLIETLDVETISSALRFALVNDQAVDRASITNSSTIQERASIDKCAKLARVFYSRSEAPTIHR